MVSSEAFIPETAKSLLADTDTGDVHVLAVDDSVIDRRVLENLLRTSAYKVTAVDSGTKALEILGVGETLGPVSFSVAQNSCSDSSTSEKPAMDEVNLIITDYCMPGMTGYDLLKKVKGTSALKGIPVVVMSSENEPNRISSCLAEGAEEFLLKPVQLADVKRLRGHVRHPQSTSASEQETSCMKRRVIVESAPVRSIDRREYASSVSVTRVA